MPEELDLNLVSRVVQDDLIQVTKDFENSRRLAVCSDQL